MRRYQHIMAMLRTKRIWERRCIQCKHSIILCMSWLISRLRYLALLRNPTRLDFAMSEMKRAPTQALNFISSTPEKIAILVSKGKQEKIRSIYIHLHTLFCSLQLANGMLAVADPPSTSALATHFSCPPSEDFQSHRICVLRAATMRLYANKTLPYHFGRDLMSRIKMKDALTFQGSSDGWPLLFAVESKVCKVCGNPLGPARVHPGSRGSSILYTNLNTFKEVVIHVSECTETSCKAMHRVFPTDPGKTVKLCNEKVL